MEQFILVRRDGPDRFSAQAVAFPELKVEGKTEAEAVEQVRQALTSRLATARLVRVEVPVNGAASGNPWLDGFGRSASDPQFEEYVKEIERARADADQ